MLEKTKREGGKEEEGWLKEREKYRQTDINA
jgi:hypothetical protein